MKKLRDWHGRRTDGHNEIMRVSSGQGTLKTKSGAELSECSNYIISYISFNISGLYFLFETEIIFFSTN